MLKKSFSQNLIKDGNILRKMVTLAGVTKDDSVVEIGAGQGDLTRAIARSAGKVTAIELDRDMIPYLDSLKEETPGIAIIARDILTVDFTSLASHGKIKVMGNIPYGITGPIIFKIIEERQVVESAFLTVQKEIGDRVTARPGTRSYGSLSVVCQLVADVKVLMRLKAHVFFPPPKVDSVYFSMHFKDDGKDVDDDLMAFVRTTFSHKRKFMRNALREKYSDGLIDELYDLMHFPRSVRAEELGPGTFREMYRAMIKINGARQVPGYSGG